MKKRLDILLVEKKLSETIKKAQALIMTGRVIVDDKISDKPGRLIDVSADVSVMKKYPYVSRGASKLEKAFQEFNLDFNDKTFCDIGSSTGGFTDFALQHGAKRIYAIDVGRGQLDQKLREDEQVVVMEKTDFRNVHELPDEVNYFLCDVSFISLRQILPHILELAVKGEQQKTNVIALIKPQFEAETKEVSRGKGVIKSEQLRLEIVKEIKKFAQNLGFKIRGLTESPILGAKGNKEYLIHLSY